jgi:nucleotide-binding universal stress UspA family protein
MQLRHLVAAADDSEEGRTAITMAAHLARRSGANLTVLTVAEQVTGDGMWQKSLEHLRQVVTRQLGALAERPANVDLAAAVGVPGIEICRYAETNGADLIVMGRKHRSPVQRLLIGDTADSVARRARVPCLFVLAGQPRLERVCVALDGTERGLSVLLAAMDFTRAIGRRLRAVTVEPAQPDEPGPHGVHTARTNRLLQAMDELSRSTPGASGLWEAPAPGVQGSPLVVHRGSIVEEIVREVRTGRCDVLAVGYRRGGPAGVIEAGSVARRLAHEAPCAVLTIPL